VRQEDLLPTKKDVPEIAMYAAGVSSHGNKSIFGWKTAAFRDERVRQAMSMSWDRDLWINVFYNADKYAEQGLPIERRWNTALLAMDSDADDGWWMDPKGKDFGPNAKYFKHDPAEAKKLLAAAGHPDGLAVNVLMPVGGGYEQNQPHMEVLNGFEREIGLRHTARTLDYNTEFLNNYRDTAGDFEGLTYKAGPSALSNDPVARLAFDYFSKGGRTWYGFDVGGKGDSSGDPYVDSEITRLQSELDANKRKTAVHELQRHLAKTQYAIRWPGGATSFSLAWPALRNFLVFRAPGPIQGTLHHWVDETQPPFKKGA
jgi:ABC-type transport system substrate-binding protein